MRTSEIPLLEVPLTDAEVVALATIAPGVRRLRRIPTNLLGGGSGPGTPGTDGTNGIDGINGTDGIDGVGTPGTDGADGTNGTNGAAGAVWRTGSGAPANGLGVNGDFYLDTATGNVYEKSGGTYSIVANIQGPNFTHSVLAYAASVDVDFTGDDYRTLTLAGNVTFTTSNRAAPRSVSVRIIGDGSSRTLTFPAWKFIGAAAPTALAANKIAVLSITAFGAADTDVVASYAAEV